MMMKLQDAVELVASWIAQSEYMVAFTGAGVSTESKLVPNPSHHALVELQRLGKLKFLISQNVDGLHLQSGFPLEKLAELHGNGRLMRCLTCDARYAREQVSWDERKWGEGYRAQRPMKGQPKCPKCEGRLISSVVNFGDPLPAKELEKAFQESATCDLFFAIGSSLVVSPANLMPQVALESGARMILLTQGETPFDELADMRIWGGAGDILPPVAERLREMLEEDSREATQDLYRIMKKARRGAI